MSMQAHNLLVTFAAIAVVGVIAVALCLFVAWLGRDDGRDAEHPATEAQRPHVQGGHRPDTPARDWTQVVLPPGTAARPAIDPPGPASDHSPLPGFALEGDPATTPDPTNPWGYSEGEIASGHYARRVPGGWEGGGIPDEHLEIIALRRNTAALEALRAELARDREGGHDAD